MSTFFAQPYSVDAVDFYFATFESYTEQTKNMLDAFGNAVEKVEI
ncbi:hypothetical protein [Glaciimonas sp. PCH181]|nr:hypothetical protein [Glaciimonas sp. PCH181]